MGIDGDIAPPLSTIAAAACSANSACSGLSGDCCPTTSGERLGCCFQSIATASDTDTDTTATTGVSTPTSPPSDTSVAIETQAPSVVPVVDTGAPSVTPVVVDTTAAPTNVPMTEAPVTADTVCSICFFDGDVPN